MRELGSGLATCIFAYFVAYKRIFALSSVALSRAPVTQITSFHERMLARGRAIHNVPAAVKAAKSKRLVSSFAPEIDFSVIRLCSRYKKKTQVLAFSL